MLTQKWKAWLSAVMKRVHLETSTLIWTACILLIAGSILMVSVQLRTNYNNAVSEVYRENANLAIALEEHVRRVIRDTDENLITLKDEYKHDSSVTMPARELLKRVLSSQVVSQVSIVDEKGNEVASAVKPTDSGNVADREYFIVHRDATSDRPFIGKPQTGRTTGKVSFALSRRIDKPDGNFGGVVNAQVSVDYFGAFFRQMGLGDTKNFAVVGTDGIIRARLEGEKISSAIDISQGEIFRMAQQKQAVSFPAKSVFDGKNRFNSLRVMPDYPLFVVVGTTVEQGLAPYYRQRNWYYFMTGCFDLVVVGFGLLLVWQLKRQSRNQQRKTQIQMVLKEIAETAVLSQSLDELYATVHHLAENVLPAKNFYFAVLDESSDQIIVPYCLDDTNTVPRKRPVGKGLTEYVMRLGHPVHLTAADIARLHGDGEIELRFTPVDEYLGVPLMNSKGNVFGVVSINLIAEKQSFTEEDIEVSTIIAAQVSMAIERKQAEEALKEANENLERKVEERTQELQAVNQELTAQNEEMLSMNEEIASLNQNLTGVNEELEQRVVERTADLTGVHEELTARYGELVESQAAQRRNAEIQAVLREIADAAVVAVSLDELYAKVHQSVGRVLPAKNFLICLMDKLSGDIVMPYCVAENNVIPTRRPIGKGMTEYVMRQKKPVHLTSIDFQTLCKAGEIELRFQQFNEWLGAPLRSSNGEFFGILAIFSIGNEPPYESESIEAISIIASQVSTAIERIQAEEALVNSERRLHKAQLIAHVGNWEIELGTRQVWASAETFRIYGIEQSTPYLSLKTIQRVVCGEDRTRLDMALKALLENNEKYDLEFKINRMDDGHERVIHSIAELQYDQNGIPVKIAGIIQDITERNKAEEALRHSYEIQVVLREIAEAAILANSLDELYSKVHQSVGRVMPAKLFHINLLDESLGECLMSYRASELNFIPERRPIGKGITEYIMRLGHAVNLTTEDMESLRESGEYTLARMPTLPIRQYLGAPLIDSRGKAFGTLSSILMDEAQVFHTEDVSAFSIIAAQVSMAIERKRAEEALRNTDEHLNKMFQYASAPNIVLNPEYIITRFNKASERLTGYARDEVIGKPISMLIAEDTWNEAVDSIEQSRSGMNWESVEIPVRRKSGEARIVLWNFANIYAADATTLTAVIAQGQDITERVRREQEINRDAQLAMRVQKALLSASEPSEYLEVATIYQPFGYVGGDLYFMDWRYGGNLLRGFLVDATGHGLSTALHTSSLHVLLREVNEHDLPLSDAMRWLNRRAGEYFDEGTFAGALAFELDLETRQLRWTCAGIPKVWLATKTRQGIVECPGMCLGISDAETFDIHTMPVDVGDSLYFVTHGLADLLEGRADLPLERYSEMVALLRMLSESEERRDDATAVCIQVRALPQSLVRQDGWPRTLRFNGYGDYQRLKGEVAKILAEVTGLPHSLQEVAVHEALANAMECRDGVARQQKARLKFNKVGNRLIVRVKTSRIGFAGNVLLRRLRLHPEEMFSLGEDAAMGRGIPMMLSMSHKMTYNSEGTEVLLAWKLES